MADAIEREIMETGVVIVGAGPAGLSAAIALKQKSPDLEIVVVEKSADIGGHILSGAVMDPAGLDALVPDWREKGARSVHPIARPEEASSALRLTPGDRNQLSV